MAYSGGPMTEAMYYILLALLRPNHGYQLMQSVNEVSNGRLEVGPGTLYGVLSRMEKSALIVLIEKESAKKTYKLTEEGRKALKEEFDRLNAMVEDTVRELKGEK
ncbi:PadR family transcriptional regulator [Marinilactibacillus sp. Marseille-P9653]|uniref:PadR family transcriptional regulator n=1 Tax=Marinilactibacillus sp. Marseille-P9653 TaxID=2866583 RepID=UPI001CE3C9B4|nr:helix-turn-helix transcriptional regulator [Marinilactibacillus sp. Marseille-P9653]